MKVDKWLDHFILLYVLSLLIQQVNNAMCHSSCGPGQASSACGQNNDPATCKTCVSNNIVFYPVPATSSTPRECVPNATNTAHLNLQKLQFIDGSTLLQNKYLDSYSIGATSQNTADSLVNLGLFTATNMLPFDISTPPVVTLNLIGLGTDHYAVYIRANAMTDCSSSPVFLITVGSNASSLAIAANTPTVVQTGLIEHTSGGLSVVLQFDFSGSSCVGGTDSAWVEDVSVYYAKCNQGCVGCSKHGNNCSSCKLGFYMSGTNCLKYAFCHSSCLDCNQTVLPTKCTSCLSVNSEMVYFPMTKPTTCNLFAINVDKKWQQLISLDKTTPLITSLLKKVSYNTADQSTTSGKLLGELFYTQNVIDFTQLTSNRIKFEISGIPTNHYKILARTYVYTECTGENKTVVLKLDSNSQEHTITASGVAEMFQTTSVQHTASTLNVEIFFGTQADTCKKLIQDISIYILKCADSCTLCQGTATNCIGCTNTDSSTYFFLQPDSNSCSLTCPSQYFKKSNFKCEFCSSGFGDWDPITTVAECSGSCNSACASCFGPADTDCLTCQTSNYLQPNSNTCASTCPLGYQTSTSPNKCILKKYCHSSCQTCGDKADMTKCLTCLNSFTPRLTFVPIPSGQAACVPLTTDSNYPKTYLLTSIDKDSLIGQGYLQSVVINAVNKTQPNTTLSSLVFNSGNLLNFDSLTSGNQLTFNLYNLGINHHKVFARIIIDANCPSKNSQLNLTIASTIKTIASVTTPTLIESTLVLHNLNTLSIKIAFGTRNDNCPKYLQDVSVYLLKCADYCTSCPDGGSVMQFGSTICLKTCPTGYFVSSDGTQCLACTSPCIGCAGTATNCTLCGTISNVKYFLNDTDLTDPAAGGVCVTDCTGPFYEGLNTFTCLPCQAGCAACELSPTNCSSCLNTDSSTYFFLQPGANTCSLTCPAQYFKKTNFKCEKCSAGYGDWDPVTDPNTPVAPCASSCDTKCATCFGSQDTECLSCTGSNYLQPSSTKCAATCPAGYSPSATGNVCEPTKYCHSSCGGCTTKADKSKCTSCSSGLTPVLTFDSISGEGICIPTLSDTNYARTTFLTSIDKDAVIGQGYLQSVIFNGLNRSTVGTVLSGILFTTGNMINFDTLTSTSDVTFNFFNLGLNHYKVYLRFNAYGACSTKNESLTFTLGGVSKTISAVTTQTVYESAAILHNLNTLSLKITFGTRNQNCQKFVQDISLYLLKCADYCTSCPDGGSVMQFGSTICLKTCSTGYFVSSDGTQCLACTSPCIGCAGTATNCTLCGTISNVKYFLNDTDLTDPAAGGVCVTDCTGPFYEGLNTFTCLPCQAGCAACELSPTNCSSCLNTDSSTYFFLQPGANTCSLTCPAQYFKKTNFKCEKCSAGYGDWDPVTDPNTPVASCASSCDTKCATCFGSQDTECMSCTGSNYLQPSSTKCAATCPAGYSPSASGNICEPTEYCHSSCGGCTTKADKSKCTSCSSGLTPALTFQAISGEGLCVATLSDANYPRTALITTIDKNSVIGEGYLQSVVFNGVNRTTTGTTLSSILFSTGNVVNFDTLTSNDVTFNLYNLGINHHRVFVRLNAESSCTSQNKSLILTVAGTSKTITSVSTAAVYESALVLHSTNVLAIKILFGTVNQNCGKYIQDISLYLLKCADYCTSCPDGGSVMQFGSTICLKTCSTGYFVSSDGTQCLACTSPCIGCAGTATNCTLCGTISNVKYFLNDTDLTDPAAGGVCVTDCTGPFYEGLNTFTCLPCQAGCAACELSPTNCSSCLNTDSSTYFFLQPGANTCSLTCPAQYFKKTNFKCEKCSAGYGDWDPVTDPNTPVASCASSCDTKCATCFGSQDTECLSCTGSNYLQPSSTKCAATCPAGYSPSATGNICEPTKYCHSSCGGCTTKADKSKCTSCSSGFSPVLSFVSINVQGLCTPVVSDVNYPNIKLLTAIDKNTMIGGDFLQSVIYNGGSFSANGTKLESILFSSGSMLNFDALSSAAEVTLNLVNVGFNHHMVFLRLNAFAACSSTLTVTISGQTVNFGSVTTQTVYETGLIVHTANSLSIKISFGTIQTCAKLVQDISVYVKECSSHCQTCPDGGSYLQYGTTKCLSSCPEGFYVNPEGTQCYQCASSCVGCKGTASNCTKCGIINGKITYLNDTDLANVSAGGVCVQVCTGQYWNNSVDYTCSRCAEGCLTCDTKSDNCQSCTYENSKHYYLQPQDQKCLTTCPTQYFKTSSHTCIKCTNSKYGHWNQQSGGTSVAACSITCPTGCVQCFGATTSLCTECDTSFFLQVGTTTCSGGCPVGYSQNTTSWACEPTKFCHSSCKAGSCTITGDMNSCTDCQSLALVDLNFGSFLVKGQCIPDIADVQIPNVYFFYSIDKSSILGTSYLKTLTKDSTLYSISNSVVSTLIYNNAQLINFDLFSSSSTVKFGFSDLGFNHHKVYVRMNAFSSCSSTDGNTLQIWVDGVKRKEVAVINSVTLVETDLVPHTLNALTLQIVFGVQNKACSKFVQDISLYLQKCKDYCGTCPDGGSILQYGSTVCLSTCPDGYLKNTAQTQCQKCDMNCTTCTSASTECTSCGLMSGKYFFLDTANKICVEVCPDGFFEDYKDFKCNPCNDGCVKCEVSAGNCSECTTKSSKNYYKQPSANECAENSCPVQYAKSKGYSCVKCTNGKFGDGVGGTSDECQTTCEDGCATCFDTGLSKCFTCQKSALNTSKYFFLQPESGSTVCSQSCPSGYYGDKTAYQCKKCDPLCKTCVDSSTKCLSCDYVNGILLLLNVTGNVCISTCPVGSYMNITAKECMLCTEGCAECYSSGLNKCTKCSKNSSDVEFYKDPIFDKCVISCDAGQFEFLSTHECLYCHKSCKTCQVNATDCTACKNESGIVYYWYSPNTQNQCLMTCPKKYYGHQPTNLCKDCDTRCAQCFAAGNGSCTVCQADNGVKHFLVFGTTSCSDKCPDGYYADTSTLKCLSCDPNCKTCIDTSTKCTSCGFTNYGLKVFLENNKCVQDCLSNYYKETINNTCTKCTPGCLACTYSGLNNCQSCQNITVTTTDSGTGLTTTTKTPYYKHIGADTCATTCPTGQFIDANILYLCQQCSPECTACQDNAKKCLNTASCATNFFFLDSNSSCLAVCPDGFYANTTTKKCTQCHPGCSLCTGGSLAACTACKTDSTTDPLNPQTYFKKIGLSVCTLVCDAGQYEDPADNLCKYCHPECVECLDGGANCTGCKNISGIAYFLFDPNLQNQCLQTCPDNYFGNKSANRCQMCDSRCLLCTGAFNDTCSSCQSITVNNVVVPHYLIWGTTVCSDVCPDGQYANSTSKKCLLCDSNCKTCSVNSTNCLSCGLTTAGYVVYLDVNKCVQNCPSGFYQNTTLKQCMKCNDGCAQCYGPAITDCTVCRTNNSVPYYKYVGFDTCGTACPLGQYIDSTKSNMCASCSSGCVGCEGTATNCTAANGCNAGTYFYSNTNSCVTVCPVNYYPSVTATSALCVRCEAGCSECTAAGLNKCTKCEQIANGTKFYKKLNINECIQNCPDGFYEYNLTLTCEKCDPSCITCNTGPLDCQTCKNVSGIFYFYYNNECLQLCPSKFYGDPSSNQCKNCDSRCNLCFGAGNGSCTSCQTDSNNVSHFLLYGTTSCSDTCLDGTYANATSFKCLMCDPNCKTCVDDPKKCISCGFTNYGVKVFLQNNLCVQDCLPGFYERTSDNKCASCTPGCATCIDLGLTFCQSCKNVTTVTVNADSSTTTTVTTYYKHIGADTCATTCPTGQFIDASILYLCQQCSPECTACQDNAKKCLNAASCATNFFFLDSNSSCLAVCPDGFYANTTTKKCTQCHPGCSLCTGGSLTACTACKTDSTTDSLNPQAYFKKIGLSVCTLVCDAGQYEDPADNLCKYCHPSCSECLNGSENCTSCKNVTGIVYFLYAPNAQNQCVQTCPDGFYGKKSTNLCMVCDKRCKTCTGPSNIYCTSCQKNTTNSMFYLVYGTTLCNDTCPAGQYSDDSLFKCLLCDANCQTCVQNSKKCTSCNITEFGKRVFLENTVCVEDCMAGWYEEVDNNTCEACRAGCLTCIESELTDCQSCGNVTVVNVTTIYYKHQGVSVCGTICPNGQFINLAIPNVCQMCSFQCLLCVDSAKKCLNSTSCAVNYFYFSPNSSCLSTCPDGYYADQTTKQCIGCFAGCLTCTAQGIQYCTKCKIDASVTPNVPYYKYADYTICNVSCPDGFYEKLSTLTCELCHASCSLCNTGPDDCQQCKNNSGIIYLNYGNSCLQKCPDGFYGDPLDNKCKSCHQGCALCSTASNKSCTACRNAPVTLTPYYLEYGMTYCSVNCPDGQYKVGGTNLCGKCNDNCNTCDVTSTNCTSCYLTATGIKVFLEVNICVQKCKDGSFANQNSRQCEPCHEGCATCFGPNLDQCYTCKKSNNGLINYYKYINQTICGQNICPLGQYINVNFTANCQACSPQCNACVDKATNCIENQNCTDNYFYFSPKNSCLLTCPGGYWPRLFINANYGACQLCEPGCSLCTGPGLTNCQKCTAYNGVNFYKEILTDRCTVDCDPGEYEVAIDFTCKYCHASCVLCNTTAIDCQKCRNVSGQPYFYYNNECLLKCPDGFWGNSTVNQCQPCHAACPTCFGPTNRECYNCRKVGATFYYLALGSTICDVECPYGQYEVNATFGCSKCYENCASCDFTSTNCTSCGYLATMQILFLYNFKCLLSCPTGYWKNSSIQYDHQCTLCHPYCSKCTGPSNMDCQACKNVTTTVNGAVTTLMYYKDLESTTCAATCPVRQFISSVVMNECVPCHSSCQLCQGSKLNCSKCTFDYYLHQEAFLCVTQCPLGYFNDDTLTSNNYLCTRCTAGCKTCNGSGLQRCQTCTNVTLPNGLIQRYFKHQKYDKCTTQCEVGYFGNYYNNLCEPCQQGCITCEFNASYCYSCTKFMLITFYKQLDKNACVQICPDGSYGDPVTFHCTECIYFSYEGNCLLTCPLNTIVAKVDNKTVCQNCSVSLGTCKTQYSFQVSTTLVDDGKAMEHKVTLPAGLEQSIKAADLLDGLRVFLIFDDSRRRRLLLTTLELSVKDLTISSDRNYVFIKTDNVDQTIDFTKAKVQVNFKGGSLVTNEGISYTSSTDDFYLSDPGFMKTYYAIYQLNYGYMSEGIVLCVVMCVFLIVTVGIVSRRAYHEVMGFIMAIECVGLLRMRSYPIQVQIFTILQGFSQFEFNFIPNGLIELYPVGYEEVSLPSVQFAIGDHNFFHSLGSSIQVYIMLQVALMAYYIWNRGNSERVVKAKFMQDALITLFFVKTLFSVFLSLYSFALNDLMKMPAQFLISQFVALSFLIAYLIYLFIWVRPVLVYQFYKIHNFIRVGFILLAVVNRFGGLIALNILEFLVYIADFYFYRNDKISKYLYTAEKILCLAAFNCSGFLQSPKALIIILALSLYAVFFMKGFYVIRAYIDYREERIKKEMSNLSISDVVHASVKEKGQKLDDNDSPDEKHYLKNNKSFLNDNSLIKLNVSENLIFRQTTNDFDKTAIIPFSAKQSKKQNDQTQTEQQNRYLNKQEEERKRQSSEAQDPEEISQIERVSEQISEQQHKDNDQMIIYLDPDDYENQKSVEEVRYSPRTSRKKEKDFSAFNTDIGFYKKKSVKAGNLEVKNHRVTNLIDDVEVIEIEHHSDNENSESLSELSDGWANPSREKLKEKEKKNKMLWKVLQNESRDEEKESNNEDEFRIVDY